jgi:RNA polymerase sigma-70 factor (ECF subfamily)
MLVRRCIAGDAVAWEEIVQRYNRRIYNICYRFAGSADDAQDLRKSSSRCIALGSYDPGRAAFMTWLPPSSKSVGGSPIRPNRTA